jgi:hypothetical protein
LSTEFIKLTLETLFWLVANLWLSCERTYTCAQYVLKLIFFVGTCWLLFVLNCTQIFMIQDRPQLRTSLWPSCDQLGIITSFNFIWVRTLCTSVPVVRLLHG